MSQNDRKIEILKKFQINTLLDAFKHNACEEFLHHYQCQEDGHQDDSTSSPPAAGALYTAAYGRETQLGLCSTKHTQTPS